MVKEATTSSTIHYLDYNPNGHPAILLLHGLGVDGGSWGYQIPALCQAGMRPLAPDIPGFGKSHPVHGKWTIGDVAQSLASFLNKMVINSAVIVGISMGGVIAIQMALSHPEFVSRLVLVNTFASLRPKRIDEMAYLVTRFAIANVRGINYQSRLVANRLFPEPGQEVLRQEMIKRIKMADPKSYRAAMRELGLFNVRDRLSEIETRTLIISGSRDTTVSLENQLELVKGIAGARHEIIDNAGHAVIADQPDRFNEVLIRFIME